MERRKVSRIRIIEDKHQLIAYVLIVFVAIIGFFVTEHQANEQDKKDRHSREILCNAIQQQSGGSVVTIDQIVALVVDNPPPPGSPQQYIDQYKKSVVIMREFVKFASAASGTTHLGWKDQPDPTQAWKHALRLARRTMVLFGIDLFETNLLDEPERRVYQRAQQAQERS